MELKASSGIFLKRKINKTAYQFCEFVLLACMIWTKVRYFQSDDFFYQMCVCVCRRLVDNNKNDMKTLIYFYHKTVQDMGTNQVLFVSLIRYWLSDGADSLTYKTGHK